MWEHSNSFTKDFYLSFLTLVIGNLSHSLEDGYPPTTAGMTAGGWIPAYNCGYDGNIEDGGALITYFLVRPTDS